MFLFLLFREDNGRFGVIGFSFVVYYLLSLELMTRDWFTFALPDRFRGTKRQNRGHSIGQYFKVVNSLETAVQRLAKILVPESKLGVTLSKAVTDPVLGDCNTI